MEVRRLRLPLNSHQELPFHAYDGPVEMTAGQQLLGVVGISTEYPTHVSHVDREKQRFVPKPFHDQCLSLLSFEDDLGTDDLPATFPRIEVNSAAVKGAGNLSSPIKIWSPPFFWLAFNLGGEKNENPNAGLRSFPLHTWMRWLKVVEEWGVLDAENESFPVRFY